MPDTLTFQDDKGAGRSTGIAALIAVGTIGWMASGIFLPSEEAEAAAAVQEVAPVAVAVRRSQAEAVTQFFQAEGQALPDRDSALRAETTGEVAEVFVQKGENVERGAPIARISVTRAEADLARAEEDLTRARDDLEDVQALFERGVATADRVSQVQATLDAARSQEIAARDAVENAMILAPFDGRIETLDLDEGEFVSAGTEVGRIVDNTPLTVSIQVPQQSLNAISDGQPATVAFITGEVREGEVSFVGTSAAAETRTFLTEIEVPNADGSIPAGISAEISIPTGDVVAHFLSPSIVSLDTDGRLGVKTVDADNRIVFFPIDVVSAQIDGVWVTGLPDTADVVTVGQGFVSEGEVVSPQPEEPQA
ncbi:efflux RND transporter periplasmic adaptor subunit [Yoonia sp. R2331]|uniref:efflux RND transporter periplasmic adaptor subunit n=1 Tax=Yoonia sp. R2331 TaxID=3237238 RepID=UPI0034E455CA